MSDILSNFLALFPHQCCTWLWMSKNVNLQNIHSNYKTRRKTIFFLFFPLIKSKGNVRLSQAIFFLRSWIRPRNVSVFSISKLPILRLAIMVLSISFMTIRRRKKLLFVFLSFYKLDVFFFSRISLEFFYVITKKSAFSSGILSHISHPQRPKGLLSYLV